MKGGEKVASKKRGSGRWGKSNFAPPVTKVGERPEKKKEQTYKKGCLGYKFHPVSEMGLKWGREKRPKQ